MEKVDYKPRASIEGHRYHWAWAARRSLSLIEFDTSLSALGIEGFSPEVSSADDEIADTVEYYNGTKIEDCTKICVQQFKYSLSSPNTEFTWSYLTKTLKKFATVLKEFSSKNGKTNTYSKVQFEFITNRPAKQYILDVFDASKLPDKFSELKNREQTALRKIGLLDSDVFEFLALVSIQCGTSSVRNIEDDGRMKISNWSAHSDSAGRFSQIKERVIALAGSEGELSNLIKASDIWAILGVSGPEDLFPVKNKFPNVVEVIPRAETKLVLEHLKVKSEPLVITADGGVGKTVFLQGLLESLEHQYETIIYDCFAEGRYRVPGLERHLQNLAYPQIVNSLASRGLCDLLVPSSLAHVNGLKVFRARICQSIETLKQQTNKNRVVMIIDAADNSVEIANERGQTSFIHSLIGSLQHDPIEGLSVILSCRGYRKDIVIQNYDYKEIALGPLNETDCISRVQRLQGKLSLKDARKLYAQSRGNPRNLDYLINLSPGDRPSQDVISLNDVFDIEWKRISKALELQGLGVKNQEEIMSALARLSPPIPLDELSTALGSDISFLKSLGNELFPLLEISSDGFIFKDEPVETWFRTKFFAASKPVKRLISTFSKTQSHSTYAASSLPQLLLEAEEYEKLYTLAASTVFPTDMVTQSARHRLSASRIMAALKNAAINRNSSKCMSLLYRHGLLATVDERADDYVANNVTLAALSGDEDAKIRCWDNRVGWQGSWHSRLALYSAVVGDKHGSMSASSTFEAWLEWWYRIGRASIKGKHSEPRLQSRECIASAISLTCSKNYEEAASEILRWRGPDYQYQISQHFLRQVRYLPEINENSLVEEFAKYLVKRYKNPKPNKVDVPSNLGLALTIFGSLSPKSHEYKPLVMYLQKELDLYKFERAKSDGVTVPQIARDLQRVAVKAMNESQKSLCRKVIKSAATREPLIYNFHDKFDRQTLGTFMIRRVLHAWLARRLLSRWDLLPAEFRQRTKIENCKTAESTNKVISAVIKKARKKKANENNKNNKNKKVNVQYPLALETNEEEHLKWTVNELFEYAQAVSFGLRKKVTASHLKSIFSRVKLKEKNAPYFLGYSSHLFRKHLAGISLRTLLFASGPLSKTAIDFLSENLIPENIDYDSSYSILESMHVSDPTDRVKSGLAVKFTNDISDFETVDEKSDAYSSLAHRVVLFDTAAAKHLFLKGLNCIDGVGSDDHDILNVIMELSAVQSGGLLPTKASRRLLRLCELVFEHRSDKFPFDELAKASASSVGLDYLRHLLNWHRWEKVPLSYSLLTAVSRFAQQKIISASQASALALLARETGCWHVKIDELKQIIYSVADGSKKAAIEDQFNWASRQSSGELSTWKGDSNFDSSKVGNVPYMSYQQEEYKNEAPQWHPSSWERVNALALSLNPTSTKFIETIVDAANQEPHHVSLLPILYEAATQRLPHQNVVDFLTNLIENEHISSLSKRDFVQRLLTKRAHESITIQSAITVFYDKLLRISVGDNDFSSYSLRSCLKDLAAFSSKSVLDVTFDYIQLICTDRSEFGSQESFTLAAQLINSSPSADANQVLQGFLLSDTFKDLDSSGYVPPSSSKPMLSADKFTAQLIWNQLGDPDPVLRWRAVHATCSLCTLSLKNELLEIFELFDQNGDNVLIHPEHKFHLWHAREYFLIAMLNSARKTPNELRGKIDWFQTLASGRMENILLERYAGNIAYLVSTGVGLPSKHKLNDFPKAALPTITKQRSFGGDPYEFRKVEKKYNFRLEYDFRKIYPSHFIYDFDTTLKNAGAIFMNAIRGMDVDCEGMHCSGGLPSRHRDSNDDLYGEQLARHAVFRTQSNLLKTASLIEDTWGNKNDVDDLLDHKTTTYLDGRLLADETSPAPIFARKEVLLENNTRPISATSLAGSLGFSSANMVPEVCLPVEGHWNSPNGATVRIYSAFTENYGSVRRAVNLAKLKWVDLWLPEANYENRIRSDWQERAKEYYPWINSSDGRSLIDEWDPYGSTYAPHKSRLSDDFCAKNKLICNKFKWVDLKDKEVVRSISWGTQVTRYNRDSATNGRALLASGELIKNAIKHLGLDLMIAISISYYPPDRYSRDTKTIEGGAIIKISNDDVRIWERKVK